MSSQDNALRVQSLPHPGQIMGYNRNEQSDYDVTQAIQLGDLYGLVNSPTATNLIRILQPQFGTITNAFLTIALTFGATETAPQFQIGITGVTNPGLVAQSLTGSQLQAQMRQMTGQTWFTATAGIPFWQSNLDITPFIPSVSSPSGSQVGLGAYTIQVQFPQIPASGFKLKQFRVDTSAVVTGTFNSGSR